MGALSAEIEETLQEHERSGKTVAEYCRENGIAPEAMYAWRKRKLQAQIKPRMESRFSRVQTGVEVSLELRGEIKLKVPLESLRAVITELQR